jgi:integrase
LPKGRDGLYRRENGILAFRFKTLDGNWREKYTGTKDRNEAREFRNQFLENVRKGSLPTEMGTWRLKEAETWWKEFRKPRIAASTQNSERYRLQHLPRILGNKRLSEISNQDLDRYTTRRLQEGIGPWSINKEILLWSLILKKAKVWGRLRDDYRPLRTKTSDIGRALTRDELRSLAEIAQTDQDWEAAFYGSVLAANTGLRGGEIKKLRVGAIDLERRRLVIRRHDTKTDAGARYVELNQDATEAAWRLLFRANRHGAIRPEHYLMPKHLSRIMYGPDKGKRGYDPSQHQSYWDTAWKSLTSAVRCPRCDELQNPSDECRIALCRADMRKIKSSKQGLRFHDLRHTFITHLVERGVPLGVIQTFVGHLSARMVRHYTHVTSGVARQAVELLDEEPMLARGSRITEEITNKPSSARIS